MPPFIQLYNSLYGRISKLSREIIITEPFCRVSVVILSLCKRQKMDDTINRNSDEGGADSCRFITYQIKFMIK